MEGPQGYNSNPALHARPCGFSRPLVFLCLKSVDRREWKGRRVTNRTLRTAGLQIEPCATRQALRLFEVFVRHGGSEGQP